ncbi:hypothetical protein ACIA8G_41740 [Lentzea sp. NPDC051213]|uniref:hypothetical protein n=1 Tax=Lentzea sp. NPDC051213 TaxID=3364126 RepID=UPI003799FF01
MKKKLRPLVLTAALAASVATAVTVGAGTAAAAQCGPVANIFTMQADGDLWLYQHGDPAGGSFSWAGAKQVGWGWGGKTFAGPNGWLFNITTGGELRRLRYNGSGWDTQPGGGQYETIGWGWQKFVESANRGKITVDADGSFYTLEGDQLRWWNYNHGMRAWEPGSGRVLDTGWGQFRMIAASGQGGLKASDSTYVLHHFRYDRVSERFVRYETEHRFTWQASTKLFSAGGDVFYTVRPNSGELMWNSYSENSDDGWKITVGREVGHGWGTDIDITATTNDCRQDDYWLPRNPVVEDQGDMPIAYVSPSGAAHLVRVTPDNRLTDLRDSGLGHWVFHPFSGEFSGISNVVPGPSAGTETFGTTRFVTGDVEVNTLGANGQWQGFQSLKGAMRTAPALVRRPDGTLVAYAMGDHGSGEGHLHYREQLPNGDFLPWKQFGRGLFVGTPSVISRGDQVTIVGRRTDNTNVVFRTQADGVPREISQLPHFVGTKPKLVQTAQGRLMVVDVGPRFGEGAGLGAFVIHELADRSRFEDTESFLPDLPGTPDSESRQLDAMVLPNGALAVSLTANGGEVYVTTSKGAADSAEFHPWQQVSAEGLGVEFTEPTSMRIDVGILSVAAVTSGGSYYLFGASVPQDPATPLSFNGRQVA